MAAGTGFAQVYIPRRDGKAAAVGHGVTGVHRQVQDHLFHLTGVGFDVIGSCRIDEFQLDMSRNEAIEHFCGFRYHVIQVNRLQLQDLPAAESEKLSGKTAGASNGTVNFRRVFVSRIINPETRTKQVVARMDDHQQVVKVVRYATRQLAQAVT